MGRVTLVSIFVLGCNLWQLPIRAEVASKPQYAYIGGYSGIYEFQIKPDGSLKPLRNGPIKGGTVKAGFSLNQLLVDPEKHTVYGLSIDDKLYSYAIGTTGRLTLKAVVPFAAGSGEQQAVLDPHQHVLYTVSSGNSLIVYDVLNPKHIAKKGTVKANANLQFLLLDQERHSLLVFGERLGPKGQDLGKTLLRYSLRRKGNVFTSRPTVYSLDSFGSAVTIAGRFLVGGLGSMLTVHRTESDGSLRPLSSQPTLKIVAANSPSRIVYRRAGSFLYISTYESIESPRETPSASPIVVCHLSRDGHLSGQAPTGHPVPNPRPYLDNTNRFLYVVSMEGTIDTYKIGSDGHLSRPVSRLKIPAPTGMVFFGGMVK